MQVTFGSVCSGIEAVSVAWEPLGMRAAWYAEIDKFPSAVLRHWFPATPNLGDMTKLAGMVRAGLVPAPEVLVGGTPCQAFSTTGNRKSLGDARGQLTLEYVRLLNAIDERRGDGQEAVCVWENVPGVLNTQDNAFGCFMGELAGSGCELQPPDGARWGNAGVICGPRRTIAWRVLDAQYFGVAQRRRRVLVVAGARDGFDPGQVLLEFDGVRRHTKPGRPQREDPAGGVQTCAADHRGRLSFFTQEGFSGFGGPSDVSATLRASGAHHECLASVGTTGPVRKLTPKEWERLQGFPDDFTRVPWRGKQAEDCPVGPRYTSLGNSMAVPVMAWVGQRLLAQINNG